MKAAIVLLVSVHIALVRSSGYGRTVRVDLSGVPILQTNFNAGSAPAGGQYDSAVVTKYDSGAFGNLAGGVSGNFGAGLKTGGAAKSSGSYADSASGSKPPHGHGSSHSGHSGHRAPPRRYGRPYPVVYSGGNPVYGGYAGGHGGARPVVYYEAGGGGYGGGRPAAYYGGGQPYIVYPGHGHSGGAILHSHPVYLAPSRTYYG